jgi:hypothetical protein
MAKLSLAERTERLKAAIDAYAETAYGSETDEELASSRSLAIDRYLGTNIQPAPAGRSQVRDRTTYEVVEWTKPSLLRIFTSGSEVCRFDPVGPEDEDQAAQETDYVNHVLTQRNNWYQVCSDWFSDALILKNGYAYAYWDETRSTESEFYENLTDDAFALIAQDAEVEVVGHDQRPNDELNERNAAAYQQAMAQYQQQAAQMQSQPMQPGQPPPQLPPPPQPPQPSFLHDVELKRVNKRGQVKICTLAPERCLIDVNTPDHTLNDANYFEWYEWKSIGELRASGLDVSDDIADDGDNVIDNDEELARNLYNEEYSRIQGSLPDPALRRVMVRHVWLRFDYDGDGINELQYVIRIGSEILYRRECEEIPVASISPIPLAHRHVGMSLADSVADIEDINTNLTRQAIDNLNLSNTPRIAVSDRVNLADLLDVRVGGAIRVDGQPPQEFLPVVVPNVFPDAVQALSFFDSRRQNRTGINAYFQGTDTNALNKTASGISQLTNSAAQRVEMIARNFASGVERLFLIVHRLILQHGHASEVFRLRNKWITVDPAQWRKRNDVKISVGLGTGNKDSQMAQLMQMFQVQMGAMPTGTVMPQNIYSTLYEIAKTAGFATPEKFVNDPAVNPPPQPQPPPEIMIAQMKAQTDAQIAQVKAQSDAQLEMAKLQQEGQLQQMQMAFDKWKVEFEAQTKLQIEAMKMGETRELEREKLMSGHELESRKLASAEKMKLVDREDRMMEKMSERQEGDSEAAAVVNSLKQIIDGNKVVAVEKIRNKSGLMVSTRITRADGSVENVTVQ